MVSISIINSSTNSRLQCYSCCAVSRVFACCCWAGVRPCSNSISFYLNRKTFTLICSKCINTKIIITTNINNRRTSYVVCAIKLKFIIHSCSYITNRSYINSINPSITCTILESNTIDTISSNHSRSIIYSEYISKSNSICISKLKIIYKSIINNITSIINLKCRNPTILTCVSISKSKIIICNLFKLPIWFIC